MYGEPNNLDSLGVDRFYAVRPDAEELPGVELSGCRMERRFKAVESGDKYLYMAVYELDDIKAYVN